MRREAMPLPWRLWRGCHEARINERFRVGASHRSQIDQGCRGGATLIWMLRSPVAGAVGPHALELQVHLSQRHLLGWRVMSRGFPSAPHSFSSIDGYH